MKKNKKLIVIIAIISAVVLCAVGLAIWQFTVPKKVDFAEYKYDKIAEFKANYNEADYEVADWQKVDEMLTDAVLKMTLAQDQAELDAVVVEQTARIESILSIQDKVDSFEASKVKAKEDMANYFVRADYNAEALIVLDKYVADFNKAIVKCETDEEVVALVGETKAKIDEVKSIADLNFDALAEFKTRKMSAKIEIAEYKNLEIYYDAQRIIFNEAKAVAVQAIENATTIEEVNVLTTNAKAQIDAIKTKKQVDDDFKAKTVAEIKAYLNKANYYDAQLVEINDIINDFVEEIADLEEQADVVIAKVDCKASLDLVKDKAEYDEFVANELVAYKETVKGELDAYKADLEYNESELNAVNVMKAIGKGNIDNATTREEIDTIAKAVKSQIDTIK